MFQDPRNEFVKIDLEKERVVEEAISLLLKEGHEIRHNLNLKTIGERALIQTALEMYVRRRKNTLQKQRGKTGGVTHGQA